MTGPAKVLSRLPPYPFVELERQAQAVGSTGDRILRFAIGDPDLRPPPSLTDAAARAFTEPDGNRYSSSRGEAGLRAAFAEWMDRRFGVRVDADREVAVLIGSKEGLAQLPRAILDPGARIGVPDPGYPAYGNAVRLARMRPVPVPLAPQRHWLPDWSAMPKALRLLYLNYPNNPTGAVADLASLRPAVEAARDGGFLLAYDNAYSEVTFGDRRAPSILQLDGARERAVEFHSLSKTLGIPGWRIGFAVGQPEAISALTSLKSHSDSGAPRPFQRAAEEALRSYGPLGWPDDVRRAHQTYAARLTTLAKGLSELGWEVGAPEGTLYLWHRAPGGDGEEFAGRLLESAHILVTPGGAFGRRGRPYVRWAVTAPSDDLREALDRLAARGFQRRARRRRARPVTDATPNASEGPDRPGPAATVGPTG